jgi:hypothetical protein
MTIDRALALLRDVAVILLAILYLGVVAGWWAT